MGSFSSVFSASFAAKAGAVAAALALGVAMTLSSAEASDDWGDSAIPDGFIDGAVGNVLGAPDDTIVQVGTLDGVGSITIGFSGSIVFDGPGADLTIHTLDEIAPAEAMIEISGDGVTFVPAGNFWDDDGDIDLDLGDYGLPFATAVRITHVSAETLPGFDVDAVTALHHVDIDIVTIDLTPLISMSPGFTEHAVTATLGVIDFTEGIPVNFEVTAGPNAGAASMDNTNEFNEAGFAWLGENGRGTDTVHAWLDVNGNGAIDGGEPTASAAHQWFGVTGTIELIDIDGNGLVVGDLVQVIVDDHDLDVNDAPDTVDVTVFSDSDLTGILVTLMETGDHTGIFSALIELGETSDESTSVLAAIDGDEITGIYSDERNGADEPDEATAFLTVVATEEEGAKVTICHRPPGNPGNQHTLSVGSSAVLAHLDHGDAVGECVESDELTKQEEQQELKDDRDAEREQEKLDREADREQDRLDRDQEKADRDADREQDKADRDDAFCEQHGADHPRCEGAGGDED